MSDHFKGLLITFAGVLVLSPDSLLIRLADMDSWTLLVYRGLLMALGMALISRLFDPRPLRQQFKRIGRTGLWAALCFAISTIAFVNAILYTTVAHTLVIVATSPLFAVLFGRVFLGERLDVPTFIAILVVLAGMILVVGQSQQAGHWVGNVCALISAIAIAITFVLNRKNRDVNMVPAISISGVLSALVVLPFANFMPLDLTSIMILLAMGLVVAVAFALITLGPRYIPAAEVSLLLPLETVGGIALVWIFLGEAPGGQTIIGAIIILAAITAHAYHVLKRSAPRTSLR